MGIDHASKLVLGCSQPCVNELYGIMEPLEPADEAGRKSLRRTLEFPVLAEE